jgi:(2R)-3-sulfolactate dehydrogenase (NADP+)
MGGSLREGRVKGDAKPTITHPFPAIIHSDAKGGIAQLGFDLMFEELVRRVRTFGVAVFAQKNSYTAGELGYYVRRLALEGLIAIAGANGPALMAASAGGKPVYCTNPLAFGAPIAGSRTPLVIDQASSAAAFVRIVQAASEGRAIPAGWAIDEHGEATTDPGRALGGALLAFGGHKGANIALMVEVLAAGVPGSSWSLDAPDFRSGGQSPGTGLTVIALSPDLLDQDFSSRLAAHVDRLKSLGVRIPGYQEGAGEKADAAPISLDRAVFEALISHGKEAP